MEVNGKRENVFGHWQLTDAQVSSWGPELTQFMMLYNWPQCDTSIYSSYIIVIVFPVATEQAGVAWPSATTFCLQVKV